ADVVERIAPRLGALAERAEAVAGRTAHLSSQVRELGRSVRLTETATHFLSLELRPRVQSVKGEAAAFVRSAGQQSRRVIRVFRDALGHWIHMREMVASK